jgi:hypothetical protein
MSTTVQRLINLSFFDIGAIPSGGAPNSDESNDALDILNQMLGSLSAEELTVFNRNIASFNTAGGTNFTLGVGGVWNTTARAQRIEAWRAVSGAFVAGGAPLSLADFDAASSEAAVKFQAIAGQIASLLAPFHQAPTLSVNSASVPLVLGADTAWPLINVRTYPAVIATVEVTYWTPIAEFAALSDVLNLPPGFPELLRTNLAVRLSPQYSRQGGIDPVLAANAQNAKAVIAAQNTPPSSNPAPQPQQAQ